MIQRMRNVIPIDITGLDITGVTDIEVYLEQRSTNTYLKFSGDDVQLVDADTLTINLSKEDAMKFSTATARGQVAYTDSEGNPGATKVFYVPVYELIWRGGYGD